MAFQLGQKTWPKASVAILTVRRHASLIAHTGHNYLVAYACAMAFRLFFLQTSGPEKACVSSSLSVMLMRRRYTLQTAARQPLFDQLIANKYEPGEGLKPHVDLMRFQDGIAIVSLQASAVLSFTKGERKHGVLLSPGDLLLLEGEARCMSAPPCLCSASCTKVILLSECIFDRLPHSLLLSADMLLDVLLSAAASYMP